MSRTASHGAGDSGRTALGCFVKSKGVFLIGASLLSAPLVWFALSQLSNVVDKHDSPDAIPGWATSIIDAPFLAMLTVIPALVIGVLMVASNRVWLLWMCLGVVALLIPVGLVMGCFLAVLAPLYEARPL